MLGCPSFDIGGAPPELVVDARLLVHKEVVVIQLASKSVFWFLLLILRGTSIQLLLRGVATLTISQSRKFSVLLLSICIAARGAGEIPCQSPGVDRQLDDLLLAAVVW